MPYISEQHRLAHPYQDALSEYLASDPLALDYYSECDARAVAARSNLHAWLTLDEWNLASLEICLETASDKLGYLLGCQAPDDAVTIAQAMVGGTAAQIARRNA